MSIFRHILLLLLLLSPLCAVSASRSFTVGGKSLRLDITELGKTEFVSLYEIARGLGGSLDYDEWCSSLELRCLSHSFRFLISSKTVLIDGDDVVYLQNAVTEIQGDSLVPVAFLTGVLPSACNTGAGSSSQTAATSGKKASGKSKGKTVVIDAGHGGHDTGCQGGGLNEKDIALDVAKRVRTLLQAKGYNVIMTRTTDVFLELPDRSDVANKNGADILVSIHVNEAPAKSACGTETFYLSKIQVDNDYHAARLASSSYGSALRQRWSKLTGRMKSYFRTQHYSSIQQKSIMLAQKIQKKLARAAGGDNRGAKGKNLSVLRNAYCPACLVEIGFISNSSDLAKLRTSSHKQKIAQAIADGIEDYL